ncbi:YybH family protein [Methylobacterium sp. C33D]
MKNYMLPAAAIALMLPGRASADQSETEARDLFTRFVTAQNAHDVDDVRSMLWASPEALFFSRGADIRGADAVAERFKTYYQGTWRLNPDMSNFHATALSTDVVQILVPVVFTRGLPGHEPRTDTFLICQTLKKTQDGWRVASILPIANNTLR